MKTRSDDDALAGLTRGGATQYSFNPAPTRRARAILANSIVARLFIRGVSAASTASSLREFGQNNLAPARVDSPDRA
jgi:hypothetical protein